ncbi:MAG: hypothetical protein ABI847_06635 [Anaerolineales bacterium]
MSVWDWVGAYRKTAGTAKDEPRYRMSSQYFESCKFTETDPDRRLALLERGRELAVKLAEPWWVLFYDHWRIQTLMNQRQDFRAAQALAIHAAVEVRLPRYAHFPQRICLHEDLISTYSGIDGSGYAEEIQQALDYMQDQVSPDLECRFCLQGQRVDFAVVREQWPEAETLALRLLDMSAASAHEAAIAYGQLCFIRAHQEDWLALRQWAEAGEALVRRSLNAADQGLYRGYLVKFLLWQALAARRTGEEDQAQQFYRAAMTQVTPLGVTQNRDYYYALREFHAAQHDWERALAAVEAELSTLAGKGHIARECDARLEHCRLLIHMGQSIETELGSLRALATELRKPGPFLAKLDELVPGSTASAI